MTTWFRHHKLRAVHDPGDPRRFPSLMVRERPAIAAGGIAVALAAVAATGAFSYQGWIAALLALGVAGGLAAATAAFLRPVVDPGRTWLAVVIAVAIALRIGTIVSDRMVCTDAARYVWDGKVYASGISPYEHAPKAGELDFLRTDALDDRVNTPGVSTPYPPLAEVVFLASHALSPGSVTGYQSIALALEIAAWLLLLGLLGRLGLPRGRIVFVAFAPLLLVEGYLPGHSDLLALPLLCLLVAGSLERRPVIAGVALAAAFMVKPIAIFLAPAAAREMGWRRAWILLGVSAGLVVAAYASMAIWGRLNFAPAYWMATEWSFGGTIVPLLALVVPEPVARVAAAIATVALVLAGTGAGRDFVSRCLLSMAAVFALSPVVFPWYLIWVVPFVVLQPDPAMIALATLAIVLDAAAINVYVLGRSEADLWPTLVAFVPFYALLAAGLWKRWGMFAAPEAREAAS